MKKLVLAALLLSACIGVAHAAPSDKNVVPTEQNIDQINLELIADYAERNGFCSVRYGDLKPGQIVVEWFRDDKGRCTVQRVRRG